MVNKKIFGFFFSIVLDYSIFLYWNVINLSNKTFTKQKYQLLNKTLTFISSSKIYEKGQFNKELDDLIKVKVHFKNNNICNPTTEKHLQIEKVITK